MINATIALSFLINSWVTIHLGKNPVNGGNPPRERRMSISSKANRGDLFQISDRLAMLVDELILKMENNVTVSIK